jgi:toxic protein SymE
MKPNIKKKSRNQKRPEVRSLKIQPKHRSTRWSTSIVPELTLCGKWLEELGFNKDERVVLHTSKELIVIRPEEKQ